MRPEDPKMIKLKSDNPEKYWKAVSWKIVKKSKKSFSESNLLKLNCNKALQDLNWQSLLNFEEYLNQFL